LRIFSSSQAYHQVPSPSNYTTRFSLHFMCQALPFGTGEWQWFPSNHVYRTIIWDTRLIRLYLNLQRELLFDSKAKNVHFIFYFSKISSENRIFCLQMLGFKKILDRIFMSFTFLKTKMLEFTSIDRPKMFESFSSSQTCLHKPEPKSTN